MRHHSITCDWCGETPVDIFLTLHHGHLGGFATHEGARYDFDFCNFECMAEWHAYKSAGRDYVLAQAKRFVGWSDDAVRDSKLVGADIELIRRARTQASGRSA